MLHETIFDATLARQRSAMLQVAIINATGKIRAILLQVFESLSKTLSRPVGMLHDIAF